MRAAYNEFEKGKLPKLEKAFAATMVWLGERAEGDCE
jgi:hypothetical protein